MVVVVLVVVEVDGQVQFVWCLVYWLQLVYGVIVEVVVEVYYVVVMLIVGDYFFGD